MCGARERDRCSKLFTLDPLRKALMAEAFESWMVLSTKASIRLSASASTCAVVTGVAYQQR